MRLPLTAFEAFAEDSRTPAPAGVVREDRVQAWLTIASAAETLGSLQGQQRSEFLKEFDDSLLPPASVRPSIVHDVADAPSAGLSLVTERFRVAAEEMERGGFLNLAFTTVSSLCRLMVREDQASRLMATVHLGRIARQLSDLPVAIDCYRSVAMTGLRERDGPSAARGFIGLGLVALMKGNLPLVRDMFERALLHAHPNGPTAVQAHIALSNVHRREARFPEALKHGWLAYDHVANEDDRTTILGNLSTIALHSGYAKAALSGFVVALSRSHEATERLVGLYEDAMRAAARVGDVAKLVDFESSGSAVASRLQQPFEIARMTLASAHAWQEAGMRDESVHRAIETIRIAEAHGYHELLARAELLMASEPVAGSPASGANDAAETWRDSEFLEGIHRLGALVA